MKPLMPFLIACLLMIPTAARACSVLYYVDPETGHIYVVNSEDYWLDVEAYIQIEPPSRQGYARLWYGWDKFAQGGINAQGLFFDAAVTPEQAVPQGTRGPRKNLGDRLLAACATVEEALAFLEQEKLALPNSHMMLGDRSGRAVIVEWVDGERKLHWRTDNALIMTNFLLSRPEAGNYPCPRYQSIERRIAALESDDEPISLLSIGNTLGQAVQPARAAADGRVGGTVYTSFIDLTDGVFVLSYRLSNQNLVRFDLNEAFAQPKRQTIALGK
ncbi:MAG: penicillin acylase [Bacteroidetes bacterium]|nr:MAG: penicillin acylase [Bacteroidota bacterium]